jgi:hypothetical protein
MLLLKETRHRLAAAENHPQSGWNVEGRFCSTPSVLKERTMRILVIGATGLLGAPAAEVAQTWVKAVEGEMTGLTLDVVKISS